MALLQSNLEKMRVLGLCSGVSFLDPDPLNTRVISRMKQIADNKERFASRFYNHVLASARNFAGAFLAWIHVCMPNFRLRSLKLDVTLKQKDFVTQ